MNNLINKFSVLFFIFNCFNSMAQSSFWIEGQIRPRIEFRNGFKTLQSDSSSAMAFIEQRSRLALGYDNKFISMYVALQDVRVWGSTPLVNKVSGNFSLFQAWAKVKEEAPVLLIGSPPCTYFSVLQELNKRCTEISPAGWRNSRTRQPRPSDMLNVAVRFIVINFNRDGIFSTSIRGQPGPGNSQWIPSYLDIP